MTISLSRRSLVAGGAALALGPGLLAAARADNGVSDGAIRIGQSAVFSGPAKDFGIDYRAGIKLHFDRVNKGGGINGRRLELVSYDDVYEPAKTALNTAKLIDEDKVFALTGYVATGNLAAAMPLAEKAGVPMFAPLVGTTSFRTKTNRLLFHVRAGYDLELRKIISHLSTIGIQSIAVVHQDSAFGKSNLATCEELAADYKVKVVKTFPLAIAAEDAKPVVAGLAEAKPGAVVMSWPGARSRSSCATTARARAARRCTRCRSASPTRPARRSGSRESSRAWSRPASCRRRRPCACPSWPTTSATAPSSARRSTATPRSRATSSRA